MVDIPKSGEPHPQAYSPVNVESAARNIGGRLRRLNPPLDLVKTTIAAIDSGARVKMYVEQVSEAAIRNQLLRTPSSQAS